jgi:oxygen-independent coproporphyrinogen-3 oxidase
MRMDAEGRFRALYVHVPFCTAKCGYCAFYSVAEHNAATRAAYVRRLAEELDAGAPHCGPLASIYVGGGTPSCLPAAELGCLLRTVLDRVTPAPAMEFTVECNPDSVNGEKAAVLADAGVNRVSLGVQSFRTDFRERIGRIGDVSRVEPALDALRAGGIDSVGVDLIYAIPGETLPDWRDELRRACDLGACHLSAYELTCEEGARLAKGKVTRVAEAQAAAMWRETATVASAYGLARYEVSNLAAADRECRHNQDVWHGETYLGCGPAAASFDGEVRRTNPSGLPRWLDGEPPEEDRISPTARAAEILALGLRTTRGWDRSEYARRTGHDYVQLRGAELRALADEGLLVLDDDVVWPTERGLLFADLIARRLIE